MISLKMKVKKKSDEVTYRTMRILCPLLNKLGYATYERYEPKNLLQKNFKIT